MSDHDERPDFGPSGYLPDRAARQARKIILRAPLGIEWLVAAAVFGVVLLAAGAAFLLSRGGEEPPAPFRALLSVSVVEQSGGRVAQSEHDVLVVLLGAQPRVYADLGELDLRWCDTAGRIEGADDRVWTETGRGLGTPSLSLHPAVVWEGTIYADLTRRAPGPSPSSDAVAPECG